MKQMYNKKLTLAEVFESYCQHNGMSILQASKSMNIPFTTLYTWVHGERDLRSKYATKVRDFLEGKYSISTSVVVAWLEGRKADAEAIASQE